MRAPVGGLFRHVRDLAAAQSGRGHLVGVIADATSADGLTRERLEGFARSLGLGLHLIRMHRGLGMGDLTAAREVYALARRLQIDVLHGHGAKGGAYARLAGNRLKRAGQRMAVFYTPHGGSLHYPTASPKGLLYMALERHLRSMTDGLVFESAFSAGRYRSQVGESGCPMRIIPNGLLEHEFVPRQLDPQASDVLFIGEMRRLKGVDVLLEALAGLHRQRPVTATLVGDGPDRAAFIEQARSLGLQEAVSFTGAMPARTAFPSGRVLAVPSRAESFPYIVLEAAAAAVPLVASDVGGIGEIVAGSELDLVAAGDAEALKGALGAALDDEARTQARAQGLRKLVARRFTVDAMTDRILEFYAAALAARYSADTGETMAAIV